MRYRVPEELVRVALDLAQQVERREISRQAASDELINLHGFAGHTANAYLNCYAHLRAGTAMKATVSAMGMRLMFEEIATRSSADLLSALQALLGHILYLEGLPNNNSVERGLRALHLEFAQRALSLSTPAVPQSSFEEQVQTSITGSQNERRKRLLRAPKKPQMTVRIVKDYHRNPDVVAEVLVRAAGICEECRTPAPFLRKSDSSPYLEVHHIVQLAENGDDTVENAIALCPNCHRQRHYGHPS